VTEMLRLMLERRGKESRGKGREEVRREEGRGHGMIQ
jgi:hypothetical protein